MFCTMSTYVCVQPTADYEEADFSYLIANSSAAYETVTTAQHELPSSSHELLSASPYELAESMEAEQQIYEIPYEDEEKYGPIYSAPLSDEQKIYEEFEGKRFRKLYHREIRYMSNAMYMTATYDCTQLRIKCSYITKMHMQLFFDNTIDLATYLGSNYHCDT